MDTVRVAYRDPDRTPVIHCIAEMAAKYYDLKVEVPRIYDGAAYESSIFDGSAEMICEHIEYLFQEEAQHGRRSIIFLCPSIRAEGHLVVRPDIKDVEDLKGKRIAVRTHGRPYAIRMRLRELGLEDHVEFVPVADADVGRWRQWTTLTSGDCAGTFITCQYMPPALEAGLRILPVPNFDVVGHFSHACSSEFARNNPDVLLRYVKASIHGVALMKLRRAEAIETVVRDSAPLIGLDQNRPEMERIYDCMVDGLQLKPYATAPAVTHTYEISLDEWPGGKGVNPLTVWDPHWVKQLDDEGFIDDLIARLTA